MNDRLKEEILSSRFKNIVNVNNDNLDSLIHFKDFLYYYDKSIFLSKEIEQYNDEKEMIRDISFSIFALLNLDYDNPKDKAFLYDYLMPSLHILKDEDYLDNKYIKKVNLSLKSLQKRTFKEEFYFPLEAFIYDNSRIINQREIPQIGMFLKQFKYLACYQNDLLWMSITPNEINTMKEPINKAHGRCLVLGLGLGYYQYMISNKKDVIDIDVVELDKDVISLFKDNLLPQFENKDKINIICDDAFHFLRSNDLSRYDYIFIDLWHDTYDGLKWYLKLAPIEKKDIKYDYWIESEILKLIRRIVISLLADFNQEIQDDIYKIIKDKIDKTDMSLDELLSDVGLKKLVR